MRGLCRLAVAGSLAVALSISACSIPSNTVPSRPTASEEPLAGLGWLAGHWCQETDGAVDEEVWLPPSGGAMFGMTRTVRGGELGMFEFLRIENRNDGVVLTAQPRGRPGGEFPLVDSGADFAVFENPEHDAPKKIEYRLARAGVLRARIFGDGPEPLATWTYRSVAPIR